MIIQHHYELTPPASAPSPLRNIPPLHKNDMGCFLIALEDVQVYKTDVKKVQRQLY